MFNLNGKEFQVTSLAQAVIDAGGQIADLNTDEMVEVDCTGWEGFEYAEQGHWYFDSCKTQCKGATPSTHVIIAVHYDEGATISDFPGEEGKLEYFYNSTFIVIPVASFEAFKAQLTN